MSRAESTGLSSGVTETPTNISKVGVSVLNASYEPLGKTSLARALNLVRRGLAEIVEVAEKVVRSASGVEAMWPRVVRLIHYVKVHLRYGPKTWSKSGVLRRDGGRCAYCGRAGGTVDHILPLSRGGENTWDNTVCCCLTCNRSKRNRLPSEAGMVLLFEPEVPMATSVRGVG